jgi:hypothetical protein
MDKKPQKSWVDVQMTIAAIAITATLGMWNLFSTPEKQQANLITEAATPPPPPPPTEEVVVVAAPAVATQLPQFVPVKIIFGGVAPKQQIVVQASAPQPAVKRNGGGGGGGSVKPPVTHGGTGSSKTK